MVVGGLALTHSFLDAPLEASVSTFGAIGDMVSDDSAAINAAVSYVFARGGGLVRLMEQHLVTLSENPVVPGIYSAIRLLPGVALVGMGVDRTTIMLASGAGSYDSASIIQNIRPDIGDEDMLISDLEVDGNGENQSEYVFGIQFQRVRNWHCERVRVTNVFGDTNAPPGETFHLYASLSSNVSFRNCEALGTAGTQGSGFGDAESQGVSYVDCRSRGMSAGFGFASYRSEGVLRTRCVADLNGSGGFNDEESAVRNDECTAGVLTEPASKSYPSILEPTQGNLAQGFIINGSETALNDCASRHNGGDGLFVHDGLGAVRCVINGGHFEGNVLHGIATTSLAAAHGCLISKSVVAADNGSGYDFSVVGGPGSFNVGIDGSLPAPAVPASMVEITNDFPFIVNIVTDGIIDTARLNGAATIGDVPLQAGPGATIELTYGSVPPTWTWFRA